MLAGRQTGRQAGRHAGRQAGTQAGRQAGIHAAWQAPAVAKGAQAGGSRHIQALAGFLGQKSKGFCSHIHTRIQTYRHTEIWTQMTEFKVSERFSSACIKERSKSRFWTRTSLPKYTSQHDASANLRHFGSNPAHDYIFFIFLNVFPCFISTPSTDFFAIKSFIFDNSCLYLRNFTGKSLRRVT